MSENPFAAPASASGIQWSDLKGRLLVIEPLGVEHDIQTAFGSTDAVRANVYAIDGEPEEFLDALVFPRVLEIAPGAEGGREGPRTAHDREREALAVPAVADRRAQRGRPGGG